MSQCNTNMKRVTERILCYPVKIKYFMLYWWSSFLVQKLTNIRKMLSFNFVCSLIEKWGSAIRYVTTPDMEFLKISCSMSHGRSDKHTFHATSVCEGSVWRAELLVCSWRLQLSHVTCTRQEFMTVVHVGSTQWIVFDCECWHIIFYQVRQFTVLDSF